MLAASMTNLMLTLGDVAAVNGLELPAGDGAAGGAAEVVETATGNRGGFFGPVANFLEACLKVSTALSHALTDSMIPCQFIGHFGNASQAVQAAGSAKAHLVHVMSRSCSQLMKFCTAFHRPRSNLH